MRKHLESLNRAFSLLAALLFLLGTASIARAEMQVLESNVTGIAVGAVLPDTDSLSLPPGGQVKVLLLPSKVTRTFNGPASATRQPPPWAASRNPIIKEKQGGAP